MQWKIKTVVGVIIVENHKTLYRQDLSLSRIVEALAPIKVNHTLPKKSPAVLEYYVG